MLCDIMDNIHNIYYSPYIIEFYNLPNILYPFFVTRQKLTASPDIYYAQAICTSFNSTEFSSGIESEHLFLNTLWCCRLHGSSK